jgi:hypothetical protein
LKRRRERVEPVVARLKRPVRLAGSGRRGWLRWRPPSALSQPTDSWTLVWWLKAASRLSAASRHDSRQRRGMKRGRQRIETSIMTCPLLGSFAQWKKTSLILRKKEDGIVGLGNPIKAPAVQRGGMRLGGAQRRGGWVVVAGT